MCKYSVHVLYKYTSNIILQLTEPPHTTPAFKTAPGALPTIATYPNILKMCLFEQVLLSLWFEVSQLTLKTCPNQILEIISRRNMYKIISL